MFVICSTCDNDAICCIDSLESIGLDGSWCCSCATNSFRKPSLSSDAFLLETAVEPVIASKPTVFVDSGGLIVAMEVVQVLSGSGEDVDEHPVREHEGRFGNCGGFREVRVTVRTVPAAAGPARRPALAEL